MHTGDFTAGNTGNLLDYLLSDEGGAVIGVQRRGRQGLFGRCLWQVLGFRGIGFSGSGLVVSNIGSSPFDVWGLSYV